MVTKVAEIANDGADRPEWRARRGMLKRLGSQAWVLRLIGRLGAAYFTFVHRTTRTVYPRGTIKDAVDATAPFILTCWHGQQFMLPNGKPEGVAVKALVSRHRDGEMNAVALQRMGIGAIRGSGGRDRVDRGGSRGLLELLRTLKQGENVFIIADVTKRNVRQAGLGIITLARLSGRPIVAACYATSRRIVLNSWDRATINLPFGRGAYVVSDPIFVPRDADDALLEAKRLEVERTINAVAAEAHAIVDWTGA